MGEDVDLASPELYFNRELSWLEFNDRVLREGLNEEVPLLERLKFLAIVSWNLDEFFMVRVAGLKQQLAAEKAVRDISGLTPAEQLARISERAHRMVAEQSQGIADVLGRLGDHGLRVIDRGDWTPEQQAYLRSYFDAEILPVLTPLAADELEPFPFLPGLNLHVAVALAGDDGADEEVKLAVVPIPAPVARFIPLPAEEGLNLARIEDVVTDCVGRLFSGLAVAATCVFRITRDADVPVTDDDVSDLLQAVEDAVRARRRTAAVRLELEAAADTRLRTWLRTWTQVGDEDVYAIEGMLDAAALWEIVSRPGFDDLREPDWPIQPPRDLVGEEDLWQALQDHDVLLFHPYESFEPVVQLLQEAAEDPRVVAVKMTLYRVSKQSPIIAALARAAEEGKQVDVLVELKARFDEANNVQWARRLENAGCHVIYGIANYKTHAKLLLIIRREEHGIRRYVHAGTGNYNDKTAKLYCDIGLMTTDRDFAADASAFFNLLTGYSQAVGWHKFAISPTDSRTRFIEVIDREIAAHSPDQPGLIMAKMNALQDQAMIESLYRASQAGVRVRLNVRGICCLRPGLPGVSENIEVVSIVDRYLEHARVYYFRNAGHEEVYLSSADWMVRNLSKR
ncbi:MAG: polyphosphate kinase 1, partial [Planctomycetota bacterium]